LFYKQINFVLLFFVKLGYQDLNQKMMKMISLHQYT